MHALAYHGPGQKSWEEVPKPALNDDADAFAWAADTGALEVVVTP